MVADGHADSAPGTTPDLSLAIPCYNEAESLRNTASRLIEAFQGRGIGIELVLVDNGSTDDTGAIIDALAGEGLPVVKELIRVNQGYGHGVLRGLSRCSGRFIGFICADGQVDAHDVVRLYEVLANARTPKLVKVRRRFRMDGFVRKIVSIFYNGLANLLYGGLGSIDINGNPKLFPRAYLAPMDLHARDWFLDAEVMIKAKRLRLGVFEMNVIAQMREGGTSNVRAATVWEFLVNLVQDRMGKRKAPPATPSLPEAGPTAASRQ